MTMQELLSHKVMKMAESLGITVTEERAEKLLQHLRLVLDKNRVLNLTAIDDLDDGIILHTIDSLLFLPFLDDADRFVDIGTGGGFPGIPLAICSSSHGTLIDSVKKKTIAVNSFIDSLGLSKTCESLDVRAEDLAKQHPEEYSCVVARAVAPTNILIEYATPLLNMGGRLIVSKGRPDQTEVEEASRAAEICGMRIVSRETFELPENKGTRTITVFRKEGEALVKLPRRPGMATKRPLGRA